MTHTVISDVSWDYDEHQDAARGIVDFIAGRDVTFEVLQETGPAGGWPEVKFFGTESELRSMLDESWPDWETETNLEILPK